MSKKSPMSTILKAAEELSNTIFILTTESSDPFVDFEYDETSGNRMVTIRQCIESSTPPQLVVLNNRMMVDELIKELREVRDKLDP